MRFDQWGAVVQDCNSALLDEILEKKTQRSRANAAEPEAADWRLDENVNALCFPLNNETNTTKTDSGEKAAVKNTSDYSDVDDCTSSAVQYFSKVQSRHVYFYSTLCNR